jgi:hypothetical protein
VPDVGTFGQGQGRRDTANGEPPPFRPNAGLAYLLGCMHAMLKAAQNHKGKA